LALAAPAATRIANAKLILDQASAGGVTAVEPVRLFVNTPATDTDSTYTSLNYLVNYDPANFPSGGDPVFFEATLKTSAGTGFARLYNVTDATPITGAEVSTASTSSTRQRSGDIAGSMPSVLKTLDTQARNSAASGNVTTVSGASLIVQATPAGSSGASASVKLRDDTKALDGTAVKP
jgi:hypothetical protein